MKAAARKKVWLGERVDLAQVKAERVDRESRIIRGVKVLGHESKNGRRYLPEAVKAAAALYEGVSVRVNHPRKATDQRDANDVMGWLKNVKARGDGLYADLHYLESHPLSARLCEAAERNPDLFGLSHNADGATEERGGETLVLEITEVRSVDLVADPATVGGLFEGKQPVKLKALFEAVKLPKKGEKAGRKILKRLMEDGVMDGDLDAPAEAPAADADPADHEAALTGGFEASCVALIKQALAGDMDPTEALKKLKDHITAHGKLTTEKAKEKPVEEEDDEEDEERMEEEEDEELEECDDDMKESIKLRRRLARLEKREEVRELCESAGLVGVSKPMINALVGSTDKDREALIEELKKAQRTPEAKKRPGNQTITEGKGKPEGATLNTRDIKDGKQFADLLRSGVN